MWHFVDTKRIQSLDNESEIKLCVQTSNRKNGSLTFTNISVANRIAFKWSFHSSMTCFFQWDRHYIWDNFVYIQMDPVVSLQIQIL